MSSIQDAYQRIAYPYYIHPLTNPARLSAIGQVLGLNAADPTSARILDIGCGSGSNLLAMAARLPASHCVGVDFAANEVDAAQALAEEAGLDNVRFEQADLLNWRPDGDRYDYIVAYGLFSWVPDEVKDRLLQVCRECLAPHGIACISYMTYPGCKQPEALRDLLRLRTEDVAAPDEKVAIAHDVLDFLDRAYQLLPNQPHSSYLRTLVEQTRRKEPHFLLLDDLGVERDPCYLLQFAGWAAEHDLRYLGESELHMMFLENLPPDAAQELRAMGLNQLETEQLMDYVVNRAFRCSLLVRAAENELAQLSAAAMRQLCFQPLLQPVDAVTANLNEGQFSTRAGATITLRSVPLVAFARALASHPGAYTPFSDIHSAAQLIARRSFTAVETARLCDDLLSLYIRRQVDVSAMPYCPPMSLPERPCLNRLNRSLAQRRGILATAFHDAIRLKSTEAELCRLLDGTHDLPALHRAAESSELGGRLELLLNNLLRTGCLE